GPREPAGRAAFRQADPLDRGGRGKVCGARGAPRHPLRYRPARPAGLWPRAQGRGVAALRGPAGAGRHLPRDTDTEAACRRANGLFDPRLVLRNARPDARYVCRHGRSRGVGRAGDRGEVGRTEALDLAVFALGGEMTQARAPGRVKEVTSLANPLVKDIRALALKKFRDQQRAFMAEGLKLVIDALDTGWTIRTLVFARNAKDNPAVQRVAARTVAAGGLVLEASEKVLSAITRRDNPQMVVGVFEQRYLPL